MIKKLFVSNYALIENLNIDFFEGYTAITGETGAGKSILLGALSLILGNRADTSILKNKDKKCIIEAEFDIQRYSLKVFYDEHDIDYDEITVVRREISPNGRSRAFVNDTPVNINTLKEMGTQLTDIHSQHQNLNLNKQIFQLNVLDSYSKLSEDLLKYKHIYSSYNNTKRALDELIRKSDSEKNELEYLQYRFNELEDAKLQIDEQEVAEKEYQQLNHAEEIKQNLATVFTLLSNEETGINFLLNESLSALKNVRMYFPKSEEYFKRIESAKIDLDDLSSDIEVAKDDVEFDPDKALFLKERLDLIYNLQAKHNVSSISELIQIKNDLDNKLQAISSYDDQIEKKKAELNTYLEQLKEKANYISGQRNSNKTFLEDEITAVLKKLAMPNAQFLIELKQNNSFSEHGIDTVSFLFSANKNVLPEEISQIASGGEISRLMLSIKSVISDSLALPAIIFDEIDTGVSGDIAEKIGIIMKEMSAHLQVLNITHLPQVAAKADHHYKVYKTEDDLTTKTNMRKLNRQERINELASMLSGENITEAALQNAEELLK